MFQELASTALAMAPQIFTGIMNRDAQRQANYDSAVQSDKQMAFQERMSNTAHQREVDDLVKAGLNPTLSAGGNGSSTPSGAAATFQAPKIEFPDVFQAATALTQLEQAQQRINIDKGLAAASMAKTADERDILQMEKILKGKGLPRAEFEHDLFQFYRESKDAWKRNITPPKRKQHPLHMEMRDIYPR